jgi:rare lipoprotein A
MRGCKVLLSRSLMRGCSLTALILALVLAGGCSSASKKQQEGVASWYGPQHHGKTTASGQRFDQNALTAAHPSLPFGTRVRVTHLANGRQVVLTINDRGPYKGDRIIDLSRAAARKLNIDGIAPVRVEVISD